MWWHQRYFVGRTPTVAPSPGAGWHYNYFAPYAGPGYHYGPFFPPPVPGPGPSTAPCPPGYAWCPPEHQKGGNWLYGKFDYWWPGGCCPVNPGGSQFNCVPGSQLDGKCVPPINVPPQYNPCQPGWSYHAGHCCPPGWKYDANVEQCVPIGSGKGY